MSGSGVRRTAEEIAAEIAALKALQGHVRATTHFGESNEAGLAIQIKVLENVMDLDKVLDIGLSYFEYELAYDAVGWLEGQNDEDGYSPSVTWEGQRLPEA